MELGRTQAAASTCEMHMHPEETCLIKMVFCTRNLQKAKHTSPVDIGTKSLGMSCPGLVVSKQMDWFHFHRKAF